MILVTGGTGFVGSEVTRRLLRVGHSVRLLCRDVSLARRRFPKANIVKGSITDRESLKAAAKGVKQVIHLAGIVSYTGPESELFRINVHGTKNVLEASKNADKFLFASSVGAMGKVGGIANEDYKGIPATPYGKSKLDAERLVLKSGMRGVCLRMAPVYGAGSMLWMRAIKVIDKGFPVPNVQNVTHLLHVMNAAQAFELGTKKGSGIYIIADGNPIKFTEFTGMIAGALGKSQRLWPGWLVLLLARAAGFKRELDVFSMKRQYDLTKARDELGYNPKYSYEKGVEKMVEWYLGLKERGKV
jgi:dihydroflavonol-4-reductase